MILSSAVRPQAQNVILYCLCSCGLALLVPQAACQADVDVRTTNRPTRPLTNDENVRFNRGLHWKTAVLRIIPGQSATTVLLDAKGFALLDFEFSWALIPSGEKTTTSSSPSVTTAPAWIVRSSNPKRSPAIGGAPIPPDHILLTARAVNRSTCTWMPDGELMAGNLASGMTDLPYLSMLFTSPPWVAHGEQAQWRVMKVRVDKENANALDMGKPSLSFCSTVDLKKEEQLSATLQEPAGPEAQQATVSSVFPSQASEIAPHCSGTLAYLSDHMPSAPQNASVTKIREMALRTNVKDLLDPKQGTWDKSADLADKQADADGRARDDDAEGIRRISPQTLQLLQNRDYSSVPSGNATDVLQSLVVAYVLADQGQIINREAARILRSCH